MGMGMGMPAAAAARARRIVQPAGVSGALGRRGGADYAGVHISPQWLQWLRQTRRDAPTLDELRADVQRQAALKRLAQLADERWARKPSLLVRPSSSAASPSVPLSSSASLPSSSSSSPDVQKVKKKKETSGIVAGTGAEGDLRASKADDDDDDGDGAVSRRRSGQPSTAAGKGQEAVAAGDDGSSSSPASWQPESWSPPAAPKR
jgi:NADH dehydrogenase [ubiquinone] 1 alpha subcomplex assembly factor 2